MRDIKLWIRLDEITGRIGIAAEKDFKSSEPVEETLKMIGLYEVLKQQEVSKLNKLQHLEARK